jgi:hypothetical protein
MKVGRGGLAAVTVLAAALIPSAVSAAGGATWKAVVVAKDPARKTVVTATANGVVRTVRGAARSLAIGQAVTVRAAQLRDGTFRVHRLTPAGRAVRVQLRGVLIGHRAGSYLLSAGSSVLAVRAGLARRTAAAAVAGARPGDRVLMTASVRNGTLTATGVHTVGHAGNVEVEGIFLGLATTGQLRLAVVGRGEVLVAVPAGMTLPTLAPGDELELVVSVDPAGALTLVSIGASADENDQGEDNDDQGEDDDDQGVTTTTTTTTTTPTTTSDDNDDQGDDNDDQGD